MLFCSLAFLNESSAVCPPGWDGPIVVTTNIYGCQVEYSYCYKIDENGYHCISLNEIKFSAACDSAFMASNIASLTDSILAEIALGEISQKWGTINEIGPCPTGTMCFLKLDDAICYNGWILNVKKQWVMNKCDNEIRSCNEVVYYCWDYSYKPRKLVVRREGTTMIGPKCSLPCKTNCGSN